ncbi:response regulator transcription factor [Aminipila butyrica]|uniref:Stage 0 sporulation protein A homolog n=1 Tax=Aminipila butyrica TaxID=433296 RepID=A0A858BXC8_9FIRM|nr:response regulator transcription factor [Aminipila butyrica]QIB69735.1 response regulator transcription factor [Aminipila butyrica]
MNSQDTCILIVEDDVQIRNFIAYTLKGEGIQPVLAGSGKEAFSLLESQQFDLLLLDLGLPDMDGSQIIQQVRKNSDIPILVLSARDQDREKVSTLDLGADDYLTKPFSSAELLARIRVALRHMSKWSREKEETAFQVGELKIDLDKRLVELSGEQIHVTPMEYNLLALFFKHIGKVLTTGYILKQVWGVDYCSDTQALRTLMAALRRKIEKNPAKPRYIMTEVGVGYRLIDE